MRYSCNFTSGVCSPVPAAGKIVEVRYLYAFVGGSLFQPTYLGERSDIPPEDCGTSQLRFKGQAARDDAALDAAVASSGPRR